MPCNTLVIRPSVNGIRLVQRRKMDVWLPNRPVVRPPRARPAAPRCLEKDALPRLIGFFTVCQRTSAPIVGNPRAKDTASAQPTSMPAHAGHLPRPAAQGHWLSGVSHALEDSLSVETPRPDHARRAVDVNRPVRHWSAPAAPLPARLRTVTGGLTSPARLSRFFTLIERMPMPLACRPPLIRNRHSPLVLFKIFF
jgi:hypothetical protein